MDRKKYIYTQPSLNGKHQEENASISIYFAKIMKKMGYKLDTKEINAAVKKTIWPGRLEVINYKNKKIILDGSHNIDGADKLNEFLKTKRIKPIVLFGMLNNKKASLFLKKIKKRVSKVLAIKIPDEKNAFKTKQINEICDFHSIKCEQIDNINPNKLKEIYFDMLKNNDVKIGQGMKSLRVLLTGKTSGPDLFTLTEILGKDKIVIRLKKSMNIIND